MELRFEVEPRLKSVLQVGPFRGDGPQFVLQVGPFGGDGPKQCSHVTVTVEFGIMCVHLACLAALGTGHGDVC